MILIFWHIWKARNAKIFDHRDSSPAEVLRHISADIDAWSCRYRKLPWSSMLGTNGLSLARHLSLLFLLSSYSLCSGC